MLDKIKNNIEKALKGFALSLPKKYRFLADCPILEKTIVNFILRPGKRVRSSLFVLSHMGYSGKMPPGLYQSAASLELLHNFLLIHDDIIDKSAIRKGQPTVHTALDRFLENHPRAKFSGSDLSIIVGDIIYSLAQELFLAVKIKSRYKEKAVEKFSEIVASTGCGQFIEILFGIKSIREVRLNDILKIYDFKSAHYTFFYPLVLGALLAGAPQKEIKRLFEYGVYAGRAFQIKDDILDMFGRESQTGKSALTDLKESKKTILIFYAYKKSNRHKKAYIENILDRRQILPKDIFRMRALVSSSGALDEAKRQACFYAEKAKKIGASLLMRPEYRQLLGCYTDSLLKII